MPRQKITLSLVRNVECNGERAPGSTNVRESSVREWGFVYVKSVCIEVKISGRKVADHRNLVLRFALLTQHNQQPPVHLFSPLYTRTYMHEPPFPHSEREGAHTGGIRHSYYEQRLVDSDA